MKYLFGIVLVSVALAIAAQNEYSFPIDNINKLLLQGTCEVDHSLFDIGSIYDVFDGNDASLARSANINPLVITLSFPFAVTFSQSAILHSGGEGWWSLEVADTEEDLISQSGSYAQLFSMASLSDAVEQVRSFDQQSKRVIRMSVRRTTGDDYVHLNEWNLLNAQASVEIESICIAPSEVWLIPDAEYPVSISGFDEHGRSYRLETDVTWAIPDESVCSHMAEAGGIRLFAGLNGETSVIASWKGLSHQIPVNVVQDFKPLNATTRKVNVALVIINPPIAAEEGLRFHQLFDWDDPLDLTFALRDSLNSASDGVVDYQIVDVYDEEILHTEFQGVRITIDSMYRMFLEPGWTTFHQLEQIGGSIQFDYNGLLVAHDFCAQSDSGLIDEVWVYSMPFTGMYESRLTGANAFWYNSPPLDGNTCIGQLPIMGFNYERGVAEALHSFGHRVESAMAHTYGRWDYNAIDKNDWEKFASYEGVASDEGYCGNIHFPPNGTSDYDYENQTYVNGMAGNWDRYPYLFQFQENFNCTEWGCSHLGFMSWWFHHLPHFTCTNKDGILNNWWAYIVDYQEGKAREATADDCSCDIVEDLTSTKPISEYQTIDIYPNPTTGLVTIDLSGYTGEIHLRMSNAVGMEVRNLVLQAGDAIQMDVSELTPSQYLFLLYDDTNTLIAQRLFTVAPK